MYTYNLSDGSVMTSKLTIEEIIERSRRLATLRAMTEGHESGCGRSICMKALNAYNKLDNFTGIIRLTREEKDWLSYKLESDFLDEDDLNCILWYCKL